MNKETYQYKNRLCKNLQLNIIGLLFSILANICDWFYMLQKYDTILAFIGTLIVLYSFTRYSSLSVGNKVNEEAQTITDDFTVEEYDETNKNIDAINGKVNFYKKLFFRVLIIAAVALILNLISFISGV